MKSYVIIGLGRFGFQLARHLYKRDQEVLAIDIHQELVDTIADHVTSAVVADAKDPAVLRELDVQSCDCAIVAIGTDLAASVLVTMNLKKLGVKRIICKAFDNTHAAILEKLGADQVIIPERVVAEKLASSLVSPNILETIELSDTYGIVERKPPKPWIGKTLRDLNIRAKYGISVIALKESGKTNVSPAADDKISPESILVLLGEYEDLNKLERIR